MSQGENPARHAESNLDRTQDFASSDDSHAMARDATPGGARPTGGATDWRGRRIGRYEITAALGAGGMGVVYRAHDTMIERDVAIKILSPDLAANETALRRFLAEARAAGKLSHPNAVAIYEIGQEGDAYFLVMEYAAGGTVGARVEHGHPLSVLEATRIVAEACQGLAAAHEAGLVHRDIKPGNLLFTQNGTVKVADFGLAKQAVSDARQITQAGQVVGTPYFMSPEQCESADLDQRSDIYSLGATYYCLLTGANPYKEASSTVQVMYAHCHGEILDPRKIVPTVPEACAAIVARAMAKRPDDRYATAAEMLADLNAVIATLSGAAGIVLPSRSGTHAALGPPTTESLRAATTGLHGATTLRPSLTQNTAALKTAEAAPATAPRRLARPVLLGALGLVVIGLVAALAFYLGGERLLRNGGSGAGSAANGNAGSGAAGNGSVGNGAVGNGSASGVAPPVAPPSGPPIKVGVLQSLSGTMADNGSAVVDATLLAIDEWNQAGGLLGRPIEPIVRDGQSDPQVFAAEAEKLITEDKVVAIFGCWSSAARKLVVPVVERYDNLLIYPVQYEGMEESPDVFYFGATPNQQIIPAVKWAYAFLNKRRFFLVGSDYVFPHAANEIIKDQLKELGAEVVGEAYLPLGTPDVHATAQAIVAAKPDVILNTINGDTNVAFFRELRELEVGSATTPTISFSIGEEDVRQLNAATVAGDYIAANYFQSIDSPENRRFVERFRAKYGPQRVLSDAMESAYVGVSLWAGAVKEAYSVEPPAVRRAMLQRRMRAPGGDVRIDPNTQHLFKTPRVGRIAPNGQLEIVWTAPGPVAPEPYPSSRSAQEWRAFLHDLRRQWGGQWTAPTKQAVPAEAADAN